MIDQFDVYNSDGTHVDKRGTEWLRENQPEEYGELLNRASRAGPHPQVYNGEGTNRNPSGARKSTAAGRGLSR